MFLPYRDDNPSERVPYVTLSLLIANVVVYIWMYASGEYESIIREYGFYPAHPQLLNSIASMFMHAGLLHLVGNLWFLWLFGDNVEDRLGHFLFIPFYFGTGLMGDLIHCYFVSGETASIPSVGASGAISGVLGAYLVFYPWAKINVFYILSFFLHGVMQIPALFFILFWFLGQLAMALLTYQDGTAGIAYGAHLGGFALGLLAAIVLSHLKAFKTPFDHHLQGSPSFRRVLEKKEQVQTIPDSPDPLRDRMREAMRVHTTTVSLDRERKGEQLLMRALDQNDPERVALQYRRFEKAYPNVALPEEYQWKAGELLEATGRDALALEAYRKYMDGCPSGIRWSSACLRAAQIYYRHHQYAEARVYLNRLLEQKPSDPLAQDARNELSRIEKTLAAIEAFSSDTAEVPKGPFLVLRQTTGRIDVPLVGDLIAGITGEMALDTRGRVARGQGVLAEGLQHQQALQIAQSLQSAGIPVIVVGEEQLLVYPQPLEMRSGQLSKTGATLKAFNQEITFVWENLWLMNCSRVHVMRTRQRSVTPELPGYGSNARSMTPVILPSAQEKQKIRVLDLFCIEPFVHLRIEEGRFNYDYLAPEEAEPDQIMNFNTLVKDIVHLAPGVHLGEGIHRLMSEEPMGSLTFANKRELERYNFWLVQLCHLKIKTAP